MPSYITSNLDLSYEIQFFINNYLLIILLQNSSDYDLINGGKRHLQASNYLITNVR